RQHHGAAGHLLRRARRGARRVLVHQPREQIRVGPSPVHADPHRLVMTARDLDHLRELRVALAAAADVTRVDAVLGERRGAVRMLAQELMAVEVEVADQRHADTGAIETLANRRHRRRSLAGVDREAHELRPRARERLHLPDRALDVRGVGIGHRLYDDRRAAADADGVHPPKGSGANRALISQVTGQKGGRRGATRPGRLPLFVVFGRRQAVGRRTALFKLHQELGARMVDFGGWDMPVQYSSQIGEHHAVRRAAGVFDVSHMCIVDLEGAKVRALLEQLLEGPGAAAALALGAFTARGLDGWFVARTGYTGEDGFEMMMPAADAVPAWRRLNSLGVASCGLGARDTLRLEAGMNLYGNDMDETTHPFESGLAWTVALEPRERAFIGREALGAIVHAGLARQLVGLVLEGRGVLRSHQRVLLPGGGEGEITSGTFSPTLERSIALARIPAGGVDAVQVDIRGKLLAARVVKPPFVRFGKSLIG